MQMSRVVGQCLAYFVRSITTSWEGKCQGMPRQLLVAFWEIQEMQVGFTIGLTFGQSQMQTQFALSGLF